MIKEWDFAGRELLLSRYPEDKSNDLQAWDAADEYLLNHFFSLNPSKDSKILVLNDSWGAIAAVLYDYSPVIVTDSHLSLIGIQENLKRNAGGLCTCIDSFSDIDDSWDYILFKVPHSQQLLEFQMRKLASIVKKSAVIIGGGMTKHIHNSTIKIVDDSCPGATTSLAKKKARLILSTMPSSVESGQSFQMEDFVTSYTISPYDLTVYNYPGVFSKENVDNGTAFLLETMAKRRISGEVLSVLDIGCGNGALGLYAAGRFPEAEICMTDESAIALASARLSFENSNLTNPVSFYKTDAADNIPEKKFSMIVCNPPFHSGAAVSLKTAYKMFEEGSARLAEGGQMWIVANKHLGYHKVLEKIFNVAPAVYYGKSYMVYRCYNNK